ncbi:hypothetical protein HPP92_013505 [Vanilla planifolia]|uniref:Uncharacterized protein n=1 Tax=Vanilla planifolia TaxID=51239 RepID=A0A835UUW3_VANPL|nr:hypothetical protein HPP92_013505 [Vanilla planifolia]
MHQRKRNKNEDRQKEKSWRLVAGWKLGRDRVKRELACRLSFISLRADRGVSFGSFFTLKAERNSTGLVLRLVSNGTHLQPVPVEPAHQALASGDLLKF